MKNNRKSWLNLWYSEPADSWEKALPLGNGRLGALVYGNTDVERIHLNEDTLWSGYPREVYNDQAINHLNSVRQSLFNGNYREAQAELEENMLGDWNQSYLPMADLVLKYNDQNDGESNSVTEYRRELDLNTALHSVTYLKQDRVYRHQAFITAVDNVFVYRISASKPGGINMVVGIDSQLRYIVHVDSEDHLSLKGECPSNVVPHYLDTDNPVLYSDEEEEKGMGFQVSVKVISIGGSKSTSDQTISVKQADEVLILVTAETGFHGFQKHPRLEGKDYEALCAKTMKKSVIKGYNRLLEEHCKDYSQLFGKMELTLGKEDLSHLPINERLDLIQQGEADPQMVALFFQYGRYLLICSSREGTQPANLQGIWNKELRAYWSCNYTTNINVQMNYWPAETCNLARCHEPLMDLIEELRVKGTKVAQMHYGCNGWVAHHNVDLWRSAIPAGGWNNFFWGGCSFWPMGGAWLCRHLWEHYSFSMDKEFLSDRAYPIMKEAAIFCLDWLIEDKNGYLVTAPSTSPENAYLNEHGQKCNVSIATTMDMTIIRELFTNCIEAGKVLQRDQEFLEKLEESLKKLYPYKIGKHGQLQEWFQDYEEYEPGHRHVSHLYGLYPGNIITVDSTPELADACHVSIERRLAEGGGGTGWSLAWLLNLYARLGNSQASYECINDLLTKSVYPNLFDLHPPLSEKEQIVFQIDGNFGAVSGIAEMLLQSHSGEISILPTLPVEWKDGSVKGIRARGGFELEIVWREGKVASIKVLSTAGGVCRIRKPDGERIELDTQIGREYYL